MLANATGGARKPPGPTTLGDREDMINEGQLSGKKKAIIRISRQKSSSSVTSLELIMQP